MKLNADKLYQEYIEDVIARNNSAIDFENSLVDDNESLTVEELKEKAKSLITENNKYRKLKSSPERKSNVVNNVQCFEDKLIYNAYCLMFWETKEIEEIRLFSKKQVEQINNNKEISKEEKTRRLKVLNEFIKLKTENKFEQLSPQKKEECLKKYLTMYIATHQANKKVREDIQEFLGYPVDTTLDKGNCTKAIILSLLKLEKKYDIKIFKNIKDKKDIENILHPKQLVKTLKPYVKQSTTGIISDIEDIKVGDICLLSWGDNGVSHAMMCYDFDKDCKPLLLGFSSNTRNHPIRETQRGLIIDIKALIEDTCKGKSKLKNNKISPITNER